MKQNNLDACTTRAKIINSQDITPKNLTTCQKILL